MTRKLESGKIRKLYKDLELIFSAVKSTVKFVSVMGPELMTAISGQIKALLEDKKWRVREAVYNTLFDLATAYQVLTILFNLSNIIEPRCFR